MNSGFNKYIPIPQINEIVYEYQNINNDKNLQNNVIKYFYYKLLKWIDKDEKFIKFNKNIHKLEKNEGKLCIYKILRKFIKKTNLNWYDLRKNKKNVKIYIYKKLSDYL